MSVLLMLLLATQEPQLRVIDCTTGDRDRVECASPLYQYRAVENCLSSLEPMRESSAERAVREFLKKPKPEMPAHCTDPRVIVIGLRDGTGDCLRVDRLTGDTKRIGCWSEW